MNRITRMLAITGLGLVTGITIGAGPAMAATNTGQGATKASVSDRANSQDDRLIDYFDSPGLCNVVGRNGERFGRWDDYDCFRVRGGSHDDEWALVVSWDDWNGNGWPNGDWPGDDWPGGWPGHHHGGNGWPWGGGHDNGMGHDHHHGGNGWPWGGGHDNGMGHDHHHDGGHHHHNH